LPVTALDCSVPEMRRRTIDDRLDEEMIGKVGRVTLGITPDHAGEVVVAIRGGTEAFAALCDEPVAKNTRVVVVECLSGRTVSVTPC
jgi:membrane protein implicated in regulation of membrane protease activity